MLVDKESSDEIRQTLGIHLDPGAVIVGMGKLCSTTSVQSQTFCDSVTLGGYSYLSPYCSLNALEIGNYVSIAQGFIFALGHPKTLLTASPVAWVPYRGYEFPGRVTHDYERSSVGSDVWIGANVVLIAGVKIGDGCFIGAGSIVTTDIPSFSVAVGNPCRVIRPRFTPDVTNRIQRSRWFDYDWQGQPIDWRTPESSLDSMEVALDNGFNRRFEVFSYVADARDIRFRRLSIF